MFKIIALELLSPEQGSKCLVKEDELNSFLLENRYDFDLARARFQSVKKGLKIGMPYFFYQGYEIDEDGNIKSVQKTLNVDFFGRNKPHISVCSIVGENGSGKSTLFDLIIRLLNNASFALRDGLTEEGHYNDDSDFSLHFVHEVYARLYFENRKGFYVLEQNGERMKFLKQGNADPIWIFDFANGKCLCSSDDSKLHLSKLFYSIMINYASYAYNAEDYIAEWDDGTKYSISSYNENYLCWFSSLFHKNDGYQAPIVINPYRDKGNINTKNETRLLKERLFELIEAFKSNKNVLTEILQNKEPFEIEIRENSDLNTIPTYNHVCNRVSGIFQRSMIILGSWKTKENQQKIDRVADTILDVWTEELNYNIRLSKDDTADTNRALNYLVYKTVKIPLIYEHYYEYRNTWDDKSKIKELVKSLIATDNHITRKIRQTLAFLVFHHYNTNPVHNSRVHIVPIDEFMVTIDSFVGKSTNEIVWKFHDMMPAACFTSDIRFHMPSGDSLLLSSFSSGEKQILHLICTIIYHLINIHSVVAQGGKNTVGYKNVNIIIDEIELYFHPRYQTTLLKFLLDAIKSLPLKQFDGINIMIATHSPYILSDIPSCNILKLEDGKPIYEKCKENFGANVYDILHDKFFMKQYVGDFANMKVSRIITKAIDAVKKNDPSKVSDAKKSIELIGDDFLRVNVLNYMNEYDQNRDTK